MFPLSWLETPATSAAAAAGDDGPLSSPAAAQGSGVLCVTVTAEGGHLIRSLATSEEEPVSNMYLYMVYFIVFRYCANLSTYLSTSTYQCYHVLLFSVSWACVFVPGDAGDGWTCITLMD